MKEKSLFFDSELLFSVIYMKLFLYSEAQIGHMLFRNKENEYSFPITNKEK